MESKCCWSSGYGDCSAVSSASCAGGRIVTGQHVISGEVLTIAFFISACRAARLSSALEHPRQIVERYSDRWAISGSDEIVSFTAAVNDQSRRVMQRLGTSHDPADDFDHPRVRRRRREPTTGRAIPVVFDLWAEQWRRRHARTSRQ